MNLPKNENDNFKLSYDIEKLLVNCDKEEIQGIAYSIYKEYQNKGNKEYQNKGKDIMMQDLQDYVLEKISLTLPQDIILFMHFSGFRQKYNNILNKVIEFYKKGEHNNLFKFLEQIDNPKSVVYTFTNIDEPLSLMNNTYIDTKMFGKISINNITDILISSLSSENDLGIELENFYFNNDKKVMILRFNPEETDIMNYVKFFIENYLKEKKYLEENDNKMAFIFTIHMNRIFEEDKKDKKKKKYIERNRLGETISHLSDFYHIFIDDLNGGNISFIDIMNYNQEDLFKKILNLDLEFYKNIYEISTYINYDFIIDIPDINQRNYSKSLIEYLISEKNLIEKIKYCIIKQNKRENTEDIFYYILKNNIMEPEDVNIISVLRKYLSQLFKNNFAKYIFASEKDHFFSPLLFNSNKIIKNEENRNEIIFEILIQIN